MPSTLEQKPPIYPVFSAIEGTPVGPFDLKEYIVNPNGETLKFSITCDTPDGSLPAGLICSQDGIFGGTPAKGSARDEMYILTYEALSTNEDEPLVFSNLLRIYTPEEYEKGVKGALDAMFPTEEMEKEEQLASYWQNLSDQLPIPDLKEILKRKVTQAELYHLLQKFATLTVWNGDDLTPADKGKPINIEGKSQRYQVYDFDIALTATPKDLYDPNRTLTDSVQTARALIREAARRGWNVELTGFDKMVTAAWIEIQNINSVPSQKPMRIYNYQPTPSAIATLAHVGFDIPTTLNPNKRGELI